MINLTPPIRINIVSVLSVDAENHTMRVIFHLKSNENPLDASTQKKMLDNMRQTLRYMEAENFIPPKFSWHTNAGVLIDPA